MTDDAPDLPPVPQPILDERGYIIPSASGWDSVRRIEALGYTVDRFDRERRRFLVSHPDNPGEWWVTEELAEDRAADLDGMLRSHREKAARRS